MYFVNHVYYFQIIHFLCLCMCALVHLSVHMCVQELTEVWRSPFDLELQAIVSHHMSAGNKTQVFPKSSKCSYLLSELSLQLSLLFTERFFGYSI